MKKKNYSSYLNVEQKWVKEIPSHWDMKRLKSVFALRSESNDPIKTKNILSLTAKQGVIPYSQKETKGGNKPKEDLRKYNIAYKDDLLVNCMNVVSGAAGVSKYFGAISPVYYALYLRNDDNIWYYHYLFRLNTFQKSLIGLGKGILMHESNNGNLTTVRKRIPIENLGNILLPVPPREEQDQILRFLDWKTSKINKLINIKKKQIEELEELKQSLINRAVTKGLNPDTPLKESGIEWLGDIPKTWEIIKIKRLFNEDDNRNINGKEDLLVFSKKKGLILYSEVFDKLPSASDLTKYRVVRPGQLLENRMQAHNGMFICVNKKGCVSPDYSVFNPSKERFVNVKFYEYVFRNPLQVEQFANASRGVGDGFNRLYTPQFGAIYTVYPPEDEQNAIVKYLDGISLKFNANIKIINEEIKCLHNLKSSLISDAVTGKIDVRDVQIPKYEKTEEELTGELEISAEGGA